MKVLKLLTAATVTVTKRNSFIDSRRDALVGGAQERKWHGANERGIGRFEKYGASSIPAPDPLSGPTYPLEGHGDSQGAWMAAREVWRPGKKGLQ